MIIDVVTIFPKMFSPVLGESMIKRAQDKGLVKINIHNLRDYCCDLHKKVDAPSFGGGPGMIFRPEPIFKAVESILGYSLYPEKTEDNKKIIVFFTPQGKILNQKLAKEFLDFERIILLSGRYEGIDERIKRYLIEKEISLGDYVLSGGELPVMVFIDALTRIIPGVVSCRNSIKQDSFGNNLLDYPHYTRPRNFRGLKVPDVLLSGNHSKIASWRSAQALKSTLQKRPDLLKKKKNKE